ncbi:MAG: tyrosine-type recombinase/integrase [Phycisphaerae bacterium]|nr:tyrosine-type recombinase/integrase [Phycisphaerae bacterium]
MIFPQRPYPSLPPALDRQNLPVLFETPDARDPFCLRDKAMLEFLYGCGLRAHELAGLKVSGLRLDKGYLRCFGKGRRERIVPIGRKAIAAVQEYLRDQRPRLVSVHSGDCLFLSRSGHPLSRVEVWRVFKKYARRAGFPESTVTHDMRRAFASHLFQGGADLDSVRLMLGHAHLTTTQRYLFVTTDQLKNACRRFHPGY